MDISGTISLEELEQRKFALIRYGLTVFLSAFLLFQVQPMIARFILPWFGGSSLVWTTCLLFFQSVLVAGYAYAHGLTRTVSPRWQWWIHLSLVLLALLPLPIRPSDYWKPVGDENPTGAILWLLAAVVGLPYFVLSTTGPLIQKWQSLSHPGRSPFRLFALSNFASLLALLTFPFIVEPWLTLDQQAWTWSFLFGAFAISVISAGYGYQARVERPLAKPQSDEEFSSGSSEPSGAATAVVAGGRHRSPRGIVVVLWLTLPLLASVQLLATTNLMTQEIGSHPFLWVLPLALYLLSFVICFDHERWYVRSLFASGLFAASVIGCLVLDAGSNAPVALQIFGYALLSFMVSMVCHGELARLKPDPRYLTQFYLMISVGGALGGVAVAVVAPHVFVNFYEFHLSLIATLIISTALIVANPHARPERRVGVGTWVWLLMLLGMATGTLIFVMNAWVELYREDRQVSDGRTITWKSRNEYGVLTVYDEPEKRILLNGRIEHGFQMKSEEQRELPNSYYGPDSGVGLAVRQLWELSPDRSAALRIGVIGLGTGTMAAWVRPQDSIRFFEINPDVRRVAEEQFDFLRGCDGPWDVVLGDARIQLERENSAKSELRYDLIVADAFSSDSIPTHLLTRECLQVYQKRLKPGGVMAIHTSNRFLELDLIVNELAREMGWQSLIVDHDPAADESEIFNSSTWILVTANPEVVNGRLLRGILQDWPDERYRVLWTDDSASLTSVIRWKLDWESLRKLFEGEL